MKILLALITAIMLQGCAGMIPGLTQAIDDAVTDQAVDVQIDKAAMQKDTDIHIIVDIINKDPVK
jgi:uncharacterized protein YceK